MTQNSIFVGTLITLASLTCVDGQIVNVTPRLTCVQSQGISLFGYTNINASTITAPVGTPNFFLQFPLDRGQPTSFASGDVPYSFLVSSPFSSGLTWGLQGGYADARPMPGVDTCPAAITDPQFGPIGLTFGQTLRLKVIGNPPTQPGGSCSATLNFLDRNGFALLPAKTVNLTDGQIGFLDLPASLLNLTTGMRAQVRPQAILAQGTATLACQTTAELFGSASNVGLVGEATQQPQIQPVFPAQGLAPNQTLRLNLAAPQGFSCTGTLGFTGANNSAIGAASTVTLAGGQSAFLDLPSAQVPGLTGWTGNRVELRPKVTLGAPMIAVAVAAAGVLPSLTNVCVATAEIFDNFSGATRLIANPQGLP